MNAAFLIARKRDAAELTESEIRFFIEGFSNGTIPDYQMTALAMAIYFQGMTATETVALTQAMLASGVQFAWPDTDMPVVDKHSTGGIGDKVSLILAPLLACCDLRVPMISGRGLGATGGTLDKLESIPGFRCDLSLDEIRGCVESVGCVITGASQELAPADKRLYALRDVTATVASVPLITASIMSKKLAEGLDVLVLDVKYGSGAFMKTLEQARGLARSLVRVGQQVGVRTRALITDMNQPLGRMVGNALEVDESMDALRGQGPGDLMEVTLALAAEALLLSGRTPSVETVRDQLESLISSGAAADKFREMVAAQGGDLAAARERASESLVTATNDGYISGIDTEQIGQAVIMMGGGRQVAADAIDFAVGIEMMARIGHEVQRGQPLLKLFSRDDGRDAATQVLQAAITIGDQPVAAPDLIVDRLS